MSALGKPTGLFRLDDSDVFVGSYFTRKDVHGIFQVSPGNLRDIDFEKREFFGSAEEVIDERRLKRAWKDKKLGHFRSNREYDSLDEIVLTALVERAYPDAEIEHQVKWGRRKRIDLRVRFKDRSILVEYLGPQHFTKHGEVFKDPLSRKRRIEEDFGEECVLWPYWIQRCERNVRALFDRSVKGLGALWSTTRLFRGFVFDNSAHVIEEITNRFLAQREGSYGYFYGPNTEGRRNPEHPIIGLIESGKRDIGRLIPLGAGKPERWIPARLRSLL